MSIFGPSITPSAIIARHAADGLPRPAGTPASPCRQAAAPGPSAPRRRRAAWWCGCRGRRRASGRGWCWPRAGRCVSWIGSASMSARMASTGPGRPPSIRPTTPVLPMPVWCGMPSRVSSRATTPAVRTSSKPSSGWAWMSRRISISCRLDPLRQVADRGGGIVGERLRHEGGFRGGGRIMSVRMRRRKARIAVLARGCMRVNAGDFRRRYARQSLPLRPLQETRSPPPLAGGGWGEGVVAESSRFDPSPSPLPQGEGKSLSLSLSLSLSCLVRRGFIQSRAGPRTAVRSE